LSLTASCQEFGWKEVLQTSACCTKQVQLGLGGLLPFVLLECSVVATCRKQVVSLILPGNYPTTRFACVAVPSPTTIRRKSTIESDIYSQKIGIE